MKVGEIVRRAIKAFELPMGPYPLLMFGGPATWSCPAPGELVVEMRAAAKETEAGAATEDAEPTR